MYLIQNFWKNLFLFFIINLFTIPSYLFPQEKITKDQPNNVKAVPGSLRLPTVEVPSGRIKNQYEVPVAVSTISPDAIKTDAGAWIGETLNKVPGVLFSQLRGPVDVPAIRFPVRFDNYYLYLLDDIPLQSPIAFDHGAFSFSASQTSFGGIEVLKGPGTALYGSDAVSGVVNVKTKPAPRNFEADIRGAYGLYHFRELRTEVGGSFNKNHSANIAFSYQGEEGYRDNSRWDRYQAVLRHRFQNDDDDFSIDTLYIATYLDAEMNGSISEENYKSNPKDDGLGDDVPTDEAKDISHYHRLSWNIDHTKNKFLSLNLIPYFRFIGSDFMRVWEPSTTPVSEQIELTGGLLARNTFEFNKLFELSLGVDTEYTWLKYKQSQSRVDQTTFGFTSLRGTHYNYEINYFSIAPYLQLQLTLWEKLILTGGLRYDYIQYDYENKSGSNVFGDYFRPNDRLDNFNELNPKAGIAFRFLPTHSIYGRYARAFRIPSGGDLYRLTTDNSEFKLDPEFAHSFEIGYKGRIKTVFEMELAGYYSRLKDGIVDDPNSATDIKENGGVTDLRGMETGVRLRPLKNLEISISYAFAKHEVVKKYKEASSASDGKEPISAPNHFGYFQIHYEPVWFKGLYFQSGIQFIGPWYMDEENTLRTDWSYPVNLRMGYAFKKLITITLKFLNILNQKYPATATKPSWRSTPIYRPAQLFTVVGGVEASF